MMGNDDTAADALDRYSGYPWVWQKLVLRHYSGQDTVLAERMDIPGYLQAEAP